MVRDYLQTQDLRLNADETAVAQAAAEAVMAHAQAAVESGVLWLPAASARLERNDDNEARLKQIFLALDAVYDRRPVQTAAVYGFHAPHLVKLAQQGLPAADELHEADSPRHLAARTAHSGWLNWADDTAVWLANGDLRGEHHSRSQAALPVCRRDGRVYGVVYLEHRAPIDADTLADWVGLALALQPALAALFPLSDSLDHD